jgi:hypothetical protein
MSDLKMGPIQDPDDCNDSGILLCEEFCTFIHTPQRTARDWKQRRIGPRWWKFNSNGRLDAAVGRVASVSHRDWEAPANRWLPLVTVPEAAARITLAEDAVSRLVVVEQAWAYRCRSRDTQRVWRPLHGGAGITPGTSETVGSGPLRAEAADRSA